MERPKHEVIRDMGLEQPRSHSSLKLDIEKDELALWRRTMMRDALLIVAALLFLLSKFLG